MKLWKVLGLAGLAGVAATGAIIARDQRQRAQLDPDDYFKGRTAGAAGPGWPNTTIAADGTGYSEARIDQLIAERNQARAARDFARADAIRDELRNVGIVLEDSGGVTRWRRE